MDFSKPKKPVKFIRKDKYWVFRLVAWFLHTFRILNRKIFMERFWTTFGHTIGVRTTINLDNPNWKQTHSTTIDHELVHVAQRERWGAITHMVLYAGPSPTIWLPALLLELPLYYWMSMPSWIMVITGVLLITCLPLSIGLAWGRFRVEREAYMVQVSRAATASARKYVINKIADTLWTNYLFTWPRRWTVAWFEKRCKKLGLKVTI